MNRRDLLRRMLGPLAGVAVFGIPALKSRTASYQLGAPPICPGCGCTLQTNKPDFNEVTYCYRKDCPQYGVKVKVPRFELDLA